MGPLNTCRAQDLAGRFPQHTMHAYTLPRDSVPGACEAVPSAHLADEGRESPKCKVTSMARLEVQLAWGGLHIVQKLPKGKQEPMVVWRPVLGDLEQGRTRGECSRPSSGRVPSYEL